MQWCRALSLKSNQRVPSSRPHSYCTKTTSSLTSHSRYVQRAPVRRFANWDDDDEEEEEGGIALDESFSEEERKRVIRKLMEKQFPPKVIDKAVKYQLHVIPIHTVSTIEKKMKVREWDLFKRGFEKQIMERYRVIYNERMEKLQTSRRTFNKALRMLEKSARHAYMKPFYEMKEKRKETYSILKDPSTLYTPLPTLEGIEEWMNTNEEEFDKDFGVDHIIPGFQSLYEEEHTNALYDPHNREMEMMHLSNQLDFMYALREDMLRWGFPVRKLTEIQALRNAGSEVHKDPPRVGKEEPFSISSKSVGKHGRRLRFRTVSVKVKVDALKLSPAAKKRFMEIAGSRYDPASDILAYSVRNFPSMHENKRYARRLLQKLWEEALKADESWIPLDGYPAPPLDAIEIVDKPNRVFTIFRCDLPNLVGDSNLFNWEKEATKEAEAEAQQKGD